MPISTQQPAARVEFCAVAPSNAPPPIPLAKKHRVSRWLGWLGAIVLLALSVAMWRSRFQGKITYETLPVELGSVQASISATGTLNPVVSVQVGSQVSGNIKALYADFNTKVSKGQLVALIDPQIFQAQVDQAEGSASAARSAVVAADAQVSKARADLAGAIASRANLQSLAAKDRANALNAQTQWQRSERLFRQQIVAQQDRDSAKAAYDAYRAQMMADEAQIDAAEHSIQASRAQAYVAQTQLSAAEAQHRQSLSVLSQARINFAHTRILAPVSGTVIARYMDVGQTVAASFQAPTIFNIAQDLTKMQVDTSVNESDIGTVRTAQSASFTVDAFPGITFSGPVIDIRKAPITAQNVVTYDVVIAAPNPDLKLFPGMTANVTIFTARQDNVLKVPNAALRFRPSTEASKSVGLSQPGTQLIYVLTNGVLRSTLIRLGISDGKFTAVSQGDLHAEDRVVIRTISPAQTTSGVNSGSPRRLPGM